MCAGPALNALNPFKLRHISHASALYGTSGPGVWHFRFFSSGISNGLLVALQMEMRLALWMASLWHIPWHFRWHIRGIWGLTFRGICAILVSVLSVAALSALFNLPQKPISPQLRYSCLVPFRPIYLNACTTSPVRTRMKSPVPSNR